MEEALDEHGGLLVADAQAAEVLEPRDRALHGPASLVPTQRPAVLRDDVLLAVVPVRRDHLDALVVETLPVVTATGRPRASTNTMILTPLPALVSPTASPPPLALLKVASTKHS